MKKLMLLMCFSAILNVTAESTSDPLILPIEDGDLHFVPARLTSSNNGLVSVVRFDAEDSPVGFKVFNESFNEIANVTFPESELLEAEYERRWSESGWPLSCTLTDQYPELSPMPIRDYNEEQWFYPSQTLFNNDSDIEYVLGHYSKVSFSYKDEDYDITYEGETLAIDALYVMNQKNEKILTITLPEGYYCTNEGSNDLYDALLYITMGPKKYICVGCRTNPFPYSPVTHLIIYEVDSANNVSAPKIIKGSLRVSPSAPRHGEMVEVDLGFDATSSTNVNIVAVNGAIVRSLPVAAGERNISLSTSGLPSGLYIVTANGTEAAKLIIR